MTARKLEMQELGWLAGRARAAPKTTGVVGSGSERDEKGATARVVMDNREQRSERGGAQSATLYL